MGEPRRRRRLPPAASCSQARASTECVGRPALQSSIAPTWHAGCAGGPLPTSRLHHPPPRAPFPRLRSGGGGGGRGRGRRLLNRGMNNGNYIGRRGDAPGGGGDADAAAAAPKEDDHAAEAALGFALHTDGPDRLGWLMNMNQVWWQTEADRVCCCCWWWCVVCGGERDRERARERERESVRVRAHVAVHGLWCCPSPALPRPPLPPPARPGLSTTRPCRARRWTRRAAMRSAWSTATSCARCVCVVCVLLCNGV